MIAILLVTSTLGLVNYQEQKELAKANLQKAVVEAERANQVADVNQAEANKQAKIAEERRQETSMAQAEASAARKDAEIKRLQAAIAQRQAEISEEKAKMSEVKAIQQQKIAEAEHEKARIANDAANRSRYIAQGKAMALKSIELHDDAGQEALVALQAYKFNVKYSGNPSDNDIYNGLYAAVVRSNDPLARDLRGHDPGAARALVTHGQEIYSGGSDGRILRWTREGAIWKQDSVAGRRKDYQVNVLDVSPDGNWLVAGGATLALNKSYLELYDLKNPRKAPRKIPGVSMVETLIYSVKENGVYVRDHTGMSIQFTDFNTVREVIKPKERINALVISSDGRKLAGAGAEGGIYLWDIANNYAEKILYKAPAENFTALAFAPDNHRVLAGNAYGQVKIFTEDSNLPQRVLTGHTAHIEQIVFNHAGTLVATTSRDHTGRLWNWYRLADQPVVLNDQTRDNWVWSAAFTPDDKQLLIAVHNSGQKVKQSIRVWPVTAEAMAKALCSYVKRNLSKDEWQNFVGSDLPYERTCEN